MSQQGAGSGALQRFDPPGLLDDFTDTQREQWSHAVSGWIDGNVKAVAEQYFDHDTGKVQFFNETSSEAPGGPFLDQPIVWSAFPGTLRNRWGRAMALDLADEVRPLTQRMDGPGSYFVGPGWNDRFYRQQDEYCEWHITRDDQGRIVRVTFTSEPPEYWQALHGDTLPDVDNNPAYHFDPSPQQVLELYREYVNPAVELDDLICHEDIVDYTDPSEPVCVYAKGAYNPYNRWNTTGGIMHLTHPANSLSAAVNLGVVATVLRRKEGRAVVDPAMLICCAAYGGLSRTSDPTIGSSVNELAALGAWLTLRNPIGLAMHHIDLAGFETPSGDPVDSSFFTVVRGDASQNLIERAVFEVPAGERYTVSDITIGGVPITRGGQIAERIFVSIVGRAADLGRFDPVRHDCARGCCQDDLQANYLTYRDIDDSCAPTGREAFAYPPVRSGDSPSQPETGRAVVDVAAHRGIHHRLTRAV